MRPRRTNPRRAPGGHTLIEMAISLAVIGVILVACGSATTMATRAATDGAARTAAQLQAAEAAAQVADDLNVALGFSSRTATNVTFTVPDRTATGAPQTVAYTWSGTAGDPLLRQFAGGTATAVLAGVKSLKFEPATRTLGPAPVSVSERVLFSHDATSGTLSDYSLATKTWGSQYFSPSLPIGTASYTLTRVLWRLKAANQDAVWIVSVRTADTSGRPTATVLAQTTVYGSSLSSAYEWVEIPFTGLSGLSPSTSLCVVATPVSGSTALGSVQIDQSFIPPGGRWGTTSNPGSTWSTSDWSTTLLTSSRIYIYGSVP